MGERVHLTDEEQKTLKSAVAAYHDEKGEHYQDDICAADLTLEDIAPGKVISCDAVIKARKACGILLPRGKQKPGKVIAKAKEKEKEKMVHKATPHRAPAAKNGTKDDAQKERWELLPLDAVGEVVKILTFGAQKYSDNNWQTVKNAQDRYYSALLRHLVAWRSGKVLDRESGALHLSHMACNALFLLWFELNHKGK